MAKKKEKPVDRQVLSDDTITIEDVRQFITDAEKKAEDYLNISDRSWREIEKRNQDGKLYGGNNLNLVRRWTKFPLWWSVWKIRQPITLARMPIPTLKDTQGDDPYGRTACVIGERFTRGILKTFEMYPEISSSNDDFLVTNFGWGRWFYRNELCPEEEKIYLEVIPPETEGAPPLFFMPNGEMVEDPSSILKDEMGHYILTGNTITVDNEEVYFKSGVYSNLIVDPDVTKWAEVTRLAFKYKYSYREFKDKYGQEALDTLVQGDIEKHKSGTPIIVYEYWDKVLKEVRWFAENSQDFFQPKDIRELDVERLKEIYPKNKEKQLGVNNDDLYGLSGFFPCTEPLIINQSTKHFWPVSEYFQVCDLLDDISSIVGRLVHLTKAIRVRFLFDSSVTELKTLIGDNWAANEGSGLGIPNLQAALMQDKNADLSRLVAYFPVEKLIEGLKNMYEAFEQRLNMFYQVTGISDLIRGQTNPDSDKTYGERQMEGKFALNRIEPYQKTLQDWIKNNLQLGMELGLKMFSDKTTDNYITPQTLDREDRERYIPSLALLRDNKKRRFRVDFETDSTIAINEQWRRGQAIETANVITKMQEAVAKTAQEMPELVESQLKIMSHVIGELTDGKLFLDEIQDSIKQVIDKVNQPKEPEPNIELEKIKLDGAKFGFEQQKQVRQDQFTQMNIQMTSQLEFAKLQAKAQQDSITNQLKQLEINIQAGMDQSELQLAVTKLQADIAQGWEDLGIRKETLMKDLRLEVGKAEMEQMRIILDARVKAQEMTLAEADQALKAFEVQIFAKDSHASLQERIATEQRLQAEHGVDIESKRIDSIATLLDAVKQEPEKKAPVSIDLSRTLQIKEGNKVEKKKDKKKK